MQTIPFTGKGKGSLGVLCPTVHAGGLLERSCEPLSWRVNKFAPVTVYRSAVAPLCLFAAE